MQKMSKEQLEQRRDEILAELDGLSDDLRIHLDTDEEEQAIEIENQEVPVAFEENLRKELAVIEDRLLDLE
jgi:hypothetical protein